MYWRDVSPMFVSVRADIHGYFKDNQDDECENWRTESLDHESACYHTYMKRGNSRVRADEEGVHWYFSVLFVFNEIGAIRNRMAYQEGNDSCCEAERVEIGGSEDSKDECSVYDRERAIVAEEKIMNARRDAGTCSSVKVSFLDNAFGSTTISVRRILRRLNTPMMMFSNQ